MSSHNTLNLCCFRSLGGRLAVAAPTLWCWAVSLPTGMFLLQGDKEQARKNNYQEIELFTGFVFFFFFLSDKK